MRSEYLVDLDELVLRCQSPGARAGVAEAVSCYRAGAFRSCIVATWMAVVWDYLDKMRALATTGDGQAQLDFDAWEKACTSFKKDELQVVESTVLTKAQEAYEFISPIERIDLERLLEDRNRCAHPSYSRPDDIYQPSAELARAHLLNAVSHLLEHPPVQGQKALKALLDGVIAPSFPTDVEGAKGQLEYSPLKHGRNSLVRNFVLTLSKCLIREEHGTEKRRRWFAALQATAQLERERLLKCWATELPNVLRQMVDADLGRSVEFLEVFPESWDYWPPDCRARCQNYIRALSAQDVAVVLPHALRCAPLRDVAKAAVDRLDKDTVLLVLSTTRAEDVDRLPAEILGRAMKLYAESGSFDTANVWASKLRIFAPVLSEEAVRSLVPALAQKFQVNGSFGFETFLFAIRSAKTMPLEEFDALCQEQGLSASVQRWNPEAQHQKSQAHQEDTDADEAADIS